MGWGKLHEMNEAELVLTSGSLLLTAEFSLHVGPKYKNESANSVLDLLNVPIVCSTYDNRSKIKINTYQLLNQSRAFVINDSAKITEILWRRVKTL